MAVAEEVGMVGQIPFWDKFTMSIPAGFCFRNQ
jgi:hypothetical protein